MKQRVRHANMRPPVRQNKPTTKVSLEQAIKKWQPQAEQLLTIGQLLQINSKTKFQWNREHRSLTALTKQL